MNPKLQEIISFISTKVNTQLPDFFEKKYYGKMDYSGKNTVLEIDNKLLRATIGFEIAFVHVIVYCLNINMFKSKEYLDILSAIDIDNLFSWYCIDDNAKTMLNNMDSISSKDIYELINDHDKFIDKDVKKKLGQFYTPIGIAKKMITDVKSELIKFSNKDTIVDPACGTGVFIVETIKQLSCYFSARELCEYVSENIYAYDVNPFAVIATKINILIFLLELDFEKTKENKVDINSYKFKNVKWKNTITEEDSNSFSLILGNPPYFKLDSKSVKDICGYEEVIYGQPNIYSLFMHWGINHLSAGGIMSLIVPQSIRSGLYFKNIRKEIKELQIKSILHIDSRQNIFDRAEQAVLIISLKNNPVRNTKTKIQFINGKQEVLSSFSISRKKLMADQNNNYMFIINKNYKMYDIFEKVYHNGTTLSDSDSMFKFSNGLFVWNQHKDALTNSNKDSIPIIYGADVQPEGFEFITSWTNNERKSYAKITDKTKSYVLSGKRLLVQRTTNFEKNIRLKACLISDDFLDKYENYFLENHINYLCGNDKEEMITFEIMSGFLGLLNSRLINYIFISKSGNTQVSANELNLLPFSNRNLKHISDFVELHQECLDQHQEELDRLVCEAYGLSEEEIKIILEY